MLDFDPMQSDGSRFYLASYAVPGNGVIDIGNRFYIISIQQPFVWRLELGARNRQGIKRPGMAKEGFDFSGSHARYVEDFQAVSSRALRINKANAAS